MFVLNECASARAGRRLDANGNQRLDFSYDRLLAPSGGQLNMGEGDEMILVSDRQPSVEGTTGLQC